MPRINFYIKPNKSHSSIYVRFQNGRNCDYSTSTQLFVPGEYWDKAKQQVRNTNKVRNRLFINGKLKSLESQLLENFMTDYTSGEYIDSDWLKKQVKTFYNQPLENNHKTIYFSDFAGDWFEKICKLKKNLKTKKPLSSYTIFSYKNTIKFFSEFEKENTKVKFKNINIEFHSAFIKFMEDKGYGLNTIGQVISRIKTICREAKEEGIQINPLFESRKFYNPKEETYDIFLDEQKINTLYNLKLTNKTLDNARDNLIIGCWTGLRVSDFLTRLSVDNISNNNIHIKSKKTNTQVAIPLHPMIKNILKKRNGSLPKKVSEAFFNKKIKILGEKAGFYTLTKGKVMNGETKRKEIGEYEFYNLITSHTCRRSFATNLYGKIDTPIILAIGGWESEASMLRYIKEVNLESTEKLNKYYEERYGYLLK